MKAAQIIDITFGIHQEVPFNPDGGEEISVVIELKPPGLEDATPDLDRLRRTAFSEHGLLLTGSTMDVIKSLPSLLRKSGWNVRLLLVSEWTRHQCQNESPKCWLIKCAEASS